ncbi:MAG: DUF3108 domain-containing protein [Gallionella sp.]|nr:DUF3108 domain-containing protein [Gallionella sp.]
MKWFSVIFCWLVLYSPTYAAIPGGVQASYEVFMSGMKIGQIDEVYTRNKDHYTLTSTTTPLGLLAVFKPEKVYLSSSGLITKQGLRPQRFEDKRPGNPGKSSQAEFDWAAQQLTLIHQALRTQLALPDGTQDRLSAMYQFMFVDMEGIDALHFAMTNGNKLDNYHYSIGPVQKLDTPAGQFDSLYLDSQAKPGESRTEIWLETKHNLPCKMIITDAHGDQYTQILSGLKILP